ncbi:MAG TPA: glycosyltransferase family 2 protein [Bryobacteraceae bacterium]|nr:glycosyltransferase family 2 protein [Bryobacteraceae bacterium]
MLRGRVCIAIVTYNSGQYIRRCLDAVLQQEGVPIEVVVVDNASTDHTWEILREFKGRIRKFLNATNLGFAAAQNQAIRSTRSEWVLTLNPDVLLLPGFIRMLVDAAKSDPGAGAVCGKLLSIGPGFEHLPEARIDSTGIFFTPAMRHFDRGWHQPDVQCFENMEYVFGASAAAALFRRRMIEDISVGGNFFDPDFFVYREDADVAWRAQLMGWRCIYTPAAVAYHVRAVTPGNRHQMPAIINMHSVKNRFLMRIKNVTPGLYRRYWFRMTARDLVVLAATLFWEPASLPAFWRLAGCTRRAWRQRRWIMSRRKVSDEAMAGWFSFKPAAQPIHQSPDLQPARHLLAPAVTLAGRTT